MTVNYLDTCTYALQRKVPRTCFCHAVDIMRYRIYGLSCYVFSYWLCFKN